MKAKIVTPILIGLIILYFILFFFLPLVSIGKLAFCDSEGSFIGLKNFAEYFTSPNMISSFKNSFVVSGIVTVVTFLLAFFYAFCISRIHMRSKYVLRYISMISLFTPTMLHGIALVYLFGRQGIISNVLMAWLNAKMGTSHAFPFEIYGAAGIIISEVIYTFPHAYLILSVSFAMSDYRLYEAAETMGAGNLRKFFTVTLPSVKYGTISALTTIFILSFTDMGAPKIVGGQYNVMAVDIYKQVIGQQNFSMGATVAVLLLIPALIAFFIDRLIQRRQGATFSSKSVPYVIRRSLFPETIAAVYCWGIALCIFFVIGTSVFVSFMKFFPYDMTLTLKHYMFKYVAGDFSSYLNSLKVALGTAAAGTAVAFAAAYTAEKTKVKDFLRKVPYALAIATLAVPGLVIGLAYILFFNSPSNPFSFIYGTLAILVLANIIHFIAVPVMSITSSLKKQDKEYDNVAESMGVAPVKTLFRVTLPLSLNAVMETFFYFFVNSMVTISAVIFLYGQDTKLATIAIVSMDDAGDTASAAAMASLILFTNMGVKIIYDIAAGMIRKKTARWQTIQREK